MSRGDTRRLVQRIIDIVQAARSGGTSRQAIALRWNVTPRAVSNVVMRARELFGVVIRHGDDGYELVDPGLLDTRRLEHANLGRVAPTAARKSFSESGPGGGTNKRAVA